MILIIAEWIMVVVYVLDHQRNFHVIIIFHLQCTFVKIKRRGKCDIETSILKCIAQEVKLAYPVPPLVTSTPVPLQPVNCDSTKGDKEVTPPAINKSAMKCFAKVPIHGIWLLLLLLMLSLLDVSQCDYSRSGGLLLCT